MNRPLHDIGVPMQSTFRVKRVTSINGCVQLVSQGHDRRAICAEHKTTAPRLMRSLSRQRDRNAGQSGWLDTINLGTILCISDPIHQKDWTCSYVKMILEGKCHSEAGLTMHAAQPAGKHTQAGAKRERAGLVDLMYISKVASYSFPSKVLESQRTLLNGNRNLSGCGTETSGNGVSTSGTAPLCNWEFLFGRFMSRLLVGLQAVQTQKAGVTGGTLVKCCLRLICSYMASGVRLWSVFTTRTSSFHWRLSVRLNLVIRA